VKQLRHQSAASEIETIRRLSHHPALMTGNDLVPYLRLLHPYSHFYLICAVEPHFFTAMQVSLTYLQYQARSITIILTTTSTHLIQKPSGGTNTNTNIHMVS
jgi:hypothetical protein